MQGGGGRAFVLLWGMTDRVTAGRGRGVTGAFDYMPSSERREDGRARRRRGTAAQTVRSQLRMRTLCSTERFREIRPGTWESRSLFHRNLLRPVRIPSTRA